VLVNRVLYRTRRMVARQVYIGAGSNHTRLHPVVGMCSKVEDEDEAYIYHQPLYESWNLLYSISLYPRLITPVT